MKTTEDIRKYAAEQGVAEEEALLLGFTCYPKCISSVRIQT